MSWPSSRIEGNQLQPSEQISECPHCSGKSGFRTNVVFKAVRVYDWTGQDVDTENYDLTSETNPKCLDCEKSVRSLFGPKA